MARKLTASLHTVTAVTRVAKLLRSQGADTINNPVGVTRQALEVLGYQPNQYEGTPTFEDCIRRVVSANWQTV